jgi:hypothetical protein
MPLTLPEHLYRGGFEFPHGVQDALKTVTLPGQPLIDRTTLLLEAAERDA